MYIMITHFKTKKDPLKGLSILTFLTPRFCANGYNNLTGVQIPGLLSKLLQLFIHKLPKYFEATLFVDSPRTPCKVSTSLARYYLYLVSTHYWY